MSMTFYLLNEQITKEFYNSHVYLCMSSHLDVLGYEGLAQIFAQHSEEERFHGKKIRQYLIDRGYEAEIGSIADCPSLVGKSPVAIAEMTLQLEKQTTESISAIMDSASDERDHMTYSFLQWFIDEQVEEEKSADTLVRQLRSGELPALLVDLEKLED